MPIKLPKVKKLPLWHWAVAAGATILISIVITTWAVDTWETITQTITGKTRENERLSRRVASIAAELKTIKNEDQYRRNQQLSADMKRIESTYTSSVTVYEALLDLKEISKDTKKFDEAFADILTMLAKREYDKAAAELAKVKTNIKKESERIATSFVIPANVVQSNVAPPAGGYSRQSVVADAGTYLVDIVAADLGSTRVIVDTASEGTCKNDCPVLPLDNYVSRNGAFAGINGSYFCPATYPSCQDKKNAFDTLLMNKNKIYFNSENNVYSSVPAVIFGSGWIRFVGRSSDWGRDTGIDSMLANQPLLLSGGTITFGGSEDPKQGSKGSRSFVGNKGSTVYIGVVHNATVAEVARALHALGLDNALNLDSGGSTALWNGGYKAGPGRAIPNAILFVRK